METKLQLHGFNNLTKSLSFNIYDICYAQTEEQREAYIDYIDEMYNAERLTQILTDASRTDRTWLQDFAEDEIGVSPDLYEVLSAYRHLRPSA